MTDGSEIGQDHLNILSMIKIQVFNIDKKS